MISLKTVYLKVNYGKPEEEIITLAASYLEKSELVAFPTETVYGLGALAFDPEAAKKIFLAKGRPTGNPLLVHISKLEQLETLVKEIPADARLLMDRFWPGPLSIILPAREEVPAIVRGGKDTLGLRMPSHPVAIALIEAAGPIAAPSANLFSRPSPLTAEHVRADMDSRIAVVLDAGSTGLGLESTIIDLSGRDYRVLRRGGVPEEALKEVLGQRLEFLESTEKGGSSYQSRSLVLICEDLKQLESRVLGYSLENKKVAIVHNNYSNQHIINANIFKEYKLDLEGSHEQSLYSILRDIEEQDIDVLLFAPIPSNLSGTASSWLDRIKRAARAEVGGQTS